jgi:hypothetical protein
MSESCCDCKHLSYETKSAEKGFDPRCNMKAGIIIKVDYGKKGCRCFELGIQGDINKLKEKEG